MLLDKFKKYVKCHFKLIRYVESFVEMERSWNYWMVAGDELFNHSSAQ